MKDKNNKIYGTRATIPEYAFAKTIKISEIKRRRFNMIDRSLPEKIIYICG